MFYNMRRAALALLITVFASGCIQKSEVNVPNPKPTATPKTPQPTATHNAGTPTPTLIVTGNPTRTVTGTRVPTATPGTCTGDKPFAGIAATCYNDGQRGGSIIPESQLDTCAEQFSKVTHEYAVTYGKYGYDGFNAKLKSRGLKVICGAFSNNTPNDSADVQRVSGDILAGNCAYAAIVDEFGTFSQTRFGDLLDQFTTNGVNVNFPKTILASYANYTDPANESFFKARTQAILATWYPQNDSTIQNADQALSRLGGVCDTLNTKFSGKKIFVISGAATTGGSGPLVNPGIARAYNTGTSRIGAEHNCTVLIYDSADEAWQETPGNELWGNYGIFTWTLNGDLLIKDIYSNLLCRR